VDLTYINIQTLQSILDQLCPGAKAYGEPGGDLRAALCGNDILYVRRGLLNDLIRSHAGFFEHALGEPALYPILVMAAVNTSFLELQVAQERAIAQMREQPRPEDEHNEDAPVPPEGSGYEEDDEWEL
jgi:hypothetical protein